MDVEELLARAWSAVENAGIPEPLQEYAFKEALTRLSGSVGTAATPQNNGSAEKSGQSESESAPGLEATFLTDAQLFDKFSLESGVPKEQLEQAFFFQDGLPHLNGPKAKLGSNVAEQARAVALALTAAYDYSRDQQNTPASTIRLECERLKCDPGKNWAKAMNALTTVNYVGASGKKTMRTKGETTSDALQKLVKSILGITE